ncbi:MAG TPA: hypothetical protein VL120_13325 [Solirubrobacteraceae bacterium]|nr:hypothetical protein [Solirubrobacteraceae bacterium]
MHLAPRSRTVLTGAVAALAAAALSAAPASAAPAATPAAGCPAVPTVQPFRAWQDLGDYILAPDGGLEAGGDAWSLQGGARAVEGNEPFAVGAATDHMALDLPAGSAATTAPMCIGVEHKTMRFFAAGATTGTLSVEALYTTSSGREQSVALGTVGGSGTWAATDALAMKVDARAADYDNALQVSLRFTPRGPGGWQIDDVYVDPYRVR